MPSPSTETVPFNLEGLEDLARAASPALAAQVTSELGAPAGAPPEPVVAPAGDEPVAGTDGTTGVSGPDDSGLEGVEGATGPVEADPTSNEDELAELNRQSEEAARVKAAGATGPSGATEPGATGPTAAAAAPLPRDNDLKLDPSTTSHLHPKTKKVIEERNAKIVTERNRADALAKEKLDLQAKLSAAEEAAKKVVVPKEVSEELVKLRDRVRELDINHDPELAAKYDEPIKANQTKLVTLLTSYGLGKTPDGKDDPTAVTALQKSGLDFKALAPYIKKLSDAGAEDAAEEVREILRENIRLGREREREVASWKAGYDTKQAARQQQTQQAQAQIAGEIRSHTENFLKADVATLTKEFPFMSQPPAPLPTDTPAVVKAKSDAIAAYEASGKAVGEAVAALDVSKAPPEKATEVHGRLAAAAVAGVILRQHVLPRLTRDMAALTARNKELEAQVGKIKAAGSLSRAHAAAATAPAGAKTALPEDNMDAAKQIAREMGVAIDA